MATVLFICERNIGRSQVAEAIFNHLTKKHRAISAACTKPGDMISESTAAILERQGVNIKERKSKHLTPDMISKADRVITFCRKKDCPFLPDDTEVWDIPDMNKKNHSEEERLIGMIWERVKELVMELE